MRSDTDGGLTCVIYVIIYTIMGIIAAVCANYLIGVFFHDNISFFWDFVIGFVGSPVIIPLAIIVWILKITGVI
jgi:hypothetical protein